MSYGKAPLATTLPDLTTARILLKILQQAAEHRTLIVGPVGLVDEIHIHRALLQSHLLNAQTACQTTQPRYAQEFGSLMRNLSETVEQTRFEIMEIRLPFY